MIVGDWLGNGKDELGVVRPGSDGVLVWTLNLATGDPTNVVVDHFGMNGDQVLVGVSPATARTEIGTGAHSTAALMWSSGERRSGTGVWNPTAGDAAYSFGQAGDVAMLGDWTGTGTTKIGVYRVDPNGRGL